MKTIGLVKKFEFSVRCYGQPKNNPNNNIHNPTGEKKKKKQAKNLDTSQRYMAIYTDHIWMASKHVKTCPLSIIREVQSETTMKYH